ncbi:MAG: hypothetical protein NTX65_09770 [Ignavibacteriales bacterium]|nr:hypothetical protein [Ignavibacteriales bacterium]
MLNKFFVSLFSILFLFNCAGSGAALDKQDSLLKKLSMEKFGSESQIIYNSDKSYSLVVKQEKSTVKNPNPVLQFFVYGLRKDKIVFEESVPAGRIKWITRNQIEVVVTPGTISTEDKKLYGYIYNVDLGTKAELNSQSVK